jgi:Ni/Fe-hydrogenase b-type cytochrome subunit
MANYKKIKRMTIAMRINHWVVAFCMIAAVITGLYIGNPYYQSFMSEPAVSKFVMAWNRLVHLYVAIIFDVSSMVVGYLYFFSRFDKPYKKLIPTDKNLKEFGEVVINLVTLNRKKSFDSSHPDSFNVVFFTIFHLLLLWMLFTGLQLYVHGLASGISSVGGWWPAMLHIVTDWTIFVTGGTNIDVRYAHHFSMYLILSWIIFHIYYQVWRTIFWKEADIAIVISGDKFIKES